MRLTIVDQVHLPEGRLHSYALEVGAEGRELPVSFDQRRHVGEGQRPGSWMAVAFRPPDGTDRESLGTAWRAVVARHGTLRSVFSRGGDVDGGQVRLHEVDPGPGQWVEHVPQPGVGLRDRLRGVLDRSCAPYARPSHRLCVVTPDEGRPAVVIGADHAHVDAWSLLVLLRDLTTCLDDLAAGREPGATLPAAPSFADHTAELAARPPVPEEVVRRWREILDAGDGVMPRFPLPLGDVSQTWPAVVEVHDVLDHDELQRFVSMCAERGQSMLSVALAEVARALHAGPGSPLRAIFPVHSRHEEQWHDAVGWFITNAVLEITAADPAGAHAAVREAVRLGSHPLAPIMEPYGGMPLAPGHFAISWLDNRRLPVAVPEGLEPQHVSALVRTDGVMIWFVVNDTGLHLRCRYPGTPQARRSVGDWLDAVRDGIREQVGLAPLPA
jgi:hypothetical protein